MHGLLVAGHGSLRPGSGAAMIRLAARLRELGAAPLTAAGFINYSRPTLGEAMSRLTARGATAVTVLPYFLVPGYFTRVALARALEELRATYPRCAIAQGEPLGEHPALAALVRRRAEEAGAGPGSAVLLAAHGSPDPAANAPIVAVAGQVAALGAFGAVDVCYLGLNEPSIPVAIAQQIAAGYSQVVVVPYLLQFGGHAAEDMPAAVSEARARHHGAQIALAGYLGYDRLLAQALAARAAENLTL
jgi:sirohydrochlorin cobaltochelatase